MKHCQSFVSNVYPWAVQYKDTKEIKQLPFLGSYHQDPFIQNGIEIEEKSYKDGIYYIPATGYTQYVLFENNQLVDDDQYNMLYKEIDYKDIPCSG